MLTPLPHARRHIVTSIYAQELFHGGELGVAIVWLAIQRQYEVDCTYVESFIEDHFLWYDWNTGRVIALPIPDCHEVTFSGLNVAK